MVSKPRFAWSCTIGGTRWLSDERDPRAAIPSQAYADAADLDPGSALRFRGDARRYVSLANPYCALGIAFQRRRRANRICRLHLFKDEVVRLPTENDEGDPGNFATAHADRSVRLRVQARVWWSLVRSVPSPAGSSADFLVGLSGVLRWRAAHAGRKITSAAIAAIIGEHAPARDRIQHPPITSVVG
jgi:hypothetical protein